MFKIFKNIVSIALNKKSYWVLISLTHFSKYWKVSLLGNEDGALVK
jgi:pectate lyase